jgi:rSAM/selenodomain-associated transferase 2
MLISAIIPTWCEEASIARAVASAARIADEVIVVDARSPDGTVACATAAGARVLTSQKGRGAQLCLGASAARGEVLLFLHADAELSSGAREAMLEALADPAVIGGNFRLRFVPRSPAARLFAWANHVRRVYLNLYYGDSGVFVRRAVYDALGGFKSLPLLEDYEFVRRLERYGKTTYLRIDIRVSARRFEAAPARTLLTWAIVQGLYSLGVAPDRLVRWYRDVRTAVSTHSSTAMPENPVRGEESNPLKKNSGSVDPALVRSFQFRRR